MTRLLVALVAFAAAVLGASRAADAQKTRIAILPFNGPQGPKAAADLTKALRKQFEIVSNATWDAAARKLFAQSRSAEDIAVVANDLDVKVVITGAIKEAEEGGWQIVVTMRHGGTGKPVDKIRIPLKGPRLEPAAMRQAIAESPALIEKAAEGPPPDETEKPVTPTPTDGEPPPLGEDKEAPLDKEKKPEGETQPRPGWASWIDASLGMILSGRNFSFEDEAKCNGARCPQFNSTLAFGLRFDATGYPLSFLSTRPGAVNNAVQGLGIGATFDVVFWPDSIPSRKDDPAICPDPNNCSFGTSEYRFEMGLRWKWNVLNKEHKPDLLFNLQYGFHSFSIEKKVDGSDVGPPDVFYQYITIGLGARLPVVPLFAFLAGLNIHGVLDTGDIHSDAQYGPGGSWGIRLNGGGEIKPWRGLVLRFAGFYERFGISFDCTTPEACPNKAPLKQTDKSAADQYYGLWLTGGWIY